MGRDSLNRGDIIVAIFAREFGKPRPSLVIQADAFERLNSVVICPLTTMLDGDWPLRIAVDPSTSNGLLHPSHIMIDKIATISRARCREKIGEVDPEVMELVGQQLTLLLGLAA